MPILVTGGAGYIGSHTTLSLVSAGYEVVVLDNLVYGHREIIEQIPGVKFILGDIGDSALLNKIFSEYKISSVIHFAAYAYVGESVQNPSKYYNNNVTASLTLLDSMLKADVKEIVFSSSCATYGIPDAVPITEDVKQEPINPYGFSKLTVERILGDYDLAYGLKSIIFRYFNAAGADPSGRSGENHVPETHLIPLVLAAAQGEIPLLSMYGNDYPTPDGTCIRDYIHVSDLAHAHVLGLEYLHKHQQSDFFNLGNGSGFSVQQVIDTAQSITGLHIPTKVSNRRPGDPPILIGSSEKARKLLHWIPKYSQLETIVQHAWQWQSSRKP